MSNHGLPQQINPEKICRSAPVTGQLWQGIIALGTLPELPPELQTQADTPIEVQLVFSEDESGLCIIKGEISVTLQLICQRCLKPFANTIQSKFAVSPVTNDNAAKNLPERYEPLLVTDGEINLASWIAEELYLALPFAPRHEPSCISYSGNKHEGDDQLEEKKSPFAALKGKI